MSAQEFCDDDAGYLAWLAAHPAGYVINIARRHHATEARVHHASCRTIGGANPRGGLWTGPYVKVCAEHLAEVEQWAIDQVGEPLRRCGTCHPDRHTERSTPTERAAAPAVHAGRCEVHGLRELCSAAGDKVSLAIGMTGLAVELLYAGRGREGSRVASEQMALLESIGDPTLTVGLLLVAFANWSDAGEFGELLRWSQTVVDLAAGDPAMGAGFGFGSPLAIALTWRGIARYWLGHPGWREDLHDAVAMARNSNHPATLATTLTWTYGWAIHAGVLGANDSAVRAIEEAVQTAQRASNNVALSVAKYGLGGALLSRDAAADRQRGLELMGQARDIWLRKQIALQMIPATELWVGREKARRGDRDAAIPVMRQAVDDLHQAGRLAHDVWGTGILVETLLDRGTQGDLAEAHEAIDRLTNLRTDQDLAMRDITLLRLRALLAHARGDDEAHRNLVSRYRAMAKSLGFEGHMKWAEEMS